MNSYDEIQCEELNEIDAYDQMMWVEAMESDDHQDGYDVYGGGGMLIAID